MTAAELLWMFHVEMVEHLETEKKTQVRSYLQATGDLNRLRAWDAKQLREG